MSNTVSESVARPVRTGAQGGVALALTEFTDAFLFDMSDRQYGAMVALLTLALGWGQVLVENYLGKAFLREVPEPDVPVVDDDSDLL